MNTQKDFRGWIFLGLGGCAVVAATFGILRLNAWSDQAAAQEHSLQQLQTVANRLDALEWRAMAQKTFNEELEAAILEQREQAELTLQSLESTTSSMNELEDVKSAYKAYAIAVNKLFGLLEKQNLEEAIEVDETEVDPGYELLHDQIIEAKLMASEKSKRLSSWANLGAVAITFSLVVVIGFLFQRYLKANQKIHNMVIDEMRRREQSLEQERQVLEAKVKERTQDLQKANTELANTLTELEQSQVQIIQNEKMSMLGQLVAGIAHEINNPVGFIAGNIQPALDYVQDLFGLIELYQQRYPEPTVEIQAEIESIDLAYIQDDLPKLIGSMQEGTTRIRDISNGLRIFSRGDSTFPERVTKRVKSFV
ncbi:MAG: hypothetical protein F6J87_31330 [Spirulina sp. SIO3F2]|nr:hypothetical protein [Spirulina sp. SIO3F2]